MSKIKRATSSNNIMFRLLRSFMAIVVLTGFVLGIAFFVKGISTTNSQKLFSYFRPVLNKFNITDDELGQVAGKFVSRLGETKMVDATESGDTSDGTSNTAEDTSAPQISHSEDEKLLSVALMSDTHNDFENLRKALELSKNQAIKNVFFLGDFTELGLTEDLEQAKDILDAGDLDYLAIPGDHDLWKSVGPANFLTVFKKNNHAVTLNGVKFVLLDNSANYTLINEETLTWFETELTDADFVLLSQPLYHPDLQLVMGIVNGEEEPEVRQQALDLLKLIRESNVKAIIAGDQHVSSTNTDPEKAELMHIVVGALTDDRNLQTPRFAILNVYLGMDFDINDVVLE